MKLACGGNKRVTVSLLRMRRGNGADDLGLYFMDRREAHVYFVIEDGEDPNAL